MKVGQKLVFGSMGQVAHLKMNINSLPLVLFFQGRGLMAVKQQNFDLVLFAEVHVYSLVWTLQK